MGTSVAPSPRVTSLLIPDPGIRSCRAERFRPPVGVASEPSGREEPDVVAAPGAALHPVAERRDRRARRAARSGRRTSSAGHGSRAVTARVATSTTWMSRRDETRSALRRRFDVNAIRVPVRRPGRLAVGDGPSVRRDAAPVRHVDQPQVADPVVREARAVEHVLEAVDEPVVGRRRLTRFAPCARCRGGGRPRPGSRRARALTTTSRVPSGDHSKASTPRGRSVRRAPRRRRAAGGGPGRGPRGPSGPSPPWSVRVGALPVRLLLDERAPVRDERERPAIGREAWMPVVLRAERDLAGGADAVGRDEPQGMPVAIEAGRPRSGASRRRTGRPARDAVRSRSAGGTGRRGGAGAARRSSEDGTPEV